MALTTTFTATCCTHRFRTIDRDFIRHNDLHNAISLSAIPTSALAFHQDHAPLMQEQAIVLEQSMDV